MRIDSASIRENVGVGRGHGHPTTSLDSARLAEPSGQAGSVAGGQVAGRQASTATVPVGVSLLGSPFRSVLRSEHWQAHPTVVVILCLSTCPNRRPRPVPAHWVPLFLRLRHSGAPNTASSRASRARSTGVYVTLSQIYPAHHLAAPTLTRLPWHAFSYHEQSRAMRDSAIRNPDKEAS